MRTHGGNRQNTDLITTHSCCMLLQTCESECNVLQNKMIVPECHGSIRTIFCIGLYILLVSSKEVLESSPEVEAKSAAVFGKRGLVSACGLADERTFL